MSPGRTTIALALGAVTPTLRDVAKWCGVRYATMRAYRLGDRRPPPEVVARFTAELRRHAARLVQFADRLDREQRKGGGS